MKKLLIVTLFALAGIVGIPSWPHTEPSVGYYKVSKNPYGVSVYQDGLHNTIQFSNAKDFHIQNNTITIVGAMSVIYGRDDIIFDATSIYTDPTEEQIDYLKKIKVHTSALPQTVYLLNPHIPGMLEFRGSNMTIDSAHKQINGSVQEIVVHDTI